MHLPAYLTDRDPSPPEGVVHALRLMDSTLRLYFNRKTQGFEVYKPVNNGLHLIAECPPGIPDERLIPFLKRQQIAAHPGGIKGFIAERREEKRRSLARAEKEMENAIDSVLETDRHALIREWQGVNTACYTKEECRLAYVQGAEDAA